jgi:hypothetical protein
VIAMSDLKELARPRNIKERLILRHFATVAKLFVLELLRLNLNEKQISQIVEIIRNAAN